MIREVASDVPLPLLLGCYIIDGDVVLVNLVTTLIPPNLPFPIGYVRDTSVPGFLEIINAIVYYKGSCFWHPAVISPYVLHY
jgi:hypothetical protein